MKTSHISTKNDYQFFCPTKIIAGISALENIPFELKALGVNRPLIITHQSAKKTGSLALLEQVFQATEIEIAGVFERVPADSSLSVVREITHYCREQNCDCILALGGGSVIDTAKAVNILLSEGGDDLTAYSGAHNLPRPLKPLIVIPTTAGTGSEVTMVAVIADTEAQEKLSFASYFLMPNVAVIDPRMTMSVPATLTAMTAMDALTHAIEAYIGLSHNAMSDSYAMVAIEKISANVVRAIQSPQDIEARFELAQGATLAGVAFSNSMVGLVHSLGHALGAITHLPHGLCMSLFLPFVLQYNLSKERERIGQLLLALCGAEIYATTPAHERAEKVIAYIFELRNQLYDLAQLPRTLQETTKVSQEQFTEIAMKALDDGSIIFNSKEADLDDLIAILQQAW